MVRVNELIPKTGIDPGIEDALQPFDHELVAVGLAELLMIGQPQIHVIGDAEVDRNEGGAERDRRCRQEADPGAALDRIKHRDARICRYAHDPVEGFTPNNAPLPGPAHLPAALLPDPRYLRL